jgi:phage-related minor tail protein
MASRIKGISVEIGGDTKPLEKSLKEVNDTSKDLQSELKDVNKLLKFDPKNTELLAQKQQLLNKQLENSEKKLQQLKDAEAEVQRQFERGDIKEEQYRNFQRELADTEIYLKNTQKAIQRMADEEKEAETATRNLNNLFEITGSTVDDYADILGDNLVRALKDGTAGSRDIKKAIDKVSTAAAGGRDAANELRNSLKRIEQGEASIQDVRTELQNLASDADTAKDSVGDLGGALGGLAGGAVAGISAGAVAGKALDASMLNTQIDVTFNVPEESKKVVKDTVKSVEAYGVDAEAALEGARRQWALNADASDETNQKILKGAAAITTAYSGIDFTELIQETNEVAAELGISNEQALGMTNSLLKMGFPPEQLDIIGEYGSQLSRAGYTAEEIQGVFAAGISTKSWNIDALLDGLKEGRIGLAEMGTGVDDATAKILEGTGISAKQVETWGKAVAAGGEDGKQAMMDVALALTNVKDETKRNELGTKLYGTLWEEQGSKITDTLLGAKEKTGDLKENQDLLNDTVSEMDSNPQIMLNQALTDMFTALTPILEPIANLIAKVAEWMQENPELTATIIAIVGALTIFFGIVMALMPIIMGLMTAAGTLGVGVAALASPFLIVIGIIAAIIAIGIALWLNWDTIVAKAKELAGKIRDKFNEFRAAISEKMDEAWTKIKEVWDNVMGFFEGIDLKKTGEDILQGLIDGLWNMAENVWNAAKDIASGIGDKVANILQLGSPSKLLMEMGEFTGEGMAIGLKNTLGEISNASKDMAAAAVPEVDTRAATNVTPAAGSGRALTVNMYSPKALDIREANKQFNRTLNKMALMW